MSLQNEGTTWYGSLQDEELTGYKNLQDEGSAF